MLKTTKKCTKCELTKQLSEFNKSNKIKDGRKSRCKECTRLDGREYAFKNKDNAKKYYENNKQKILKRVKENTLKNREYILNRNRAWWDDNKEELNSKQRKFHHENKERMNKISREYYKNNKEEMNAKSREYMKTDFGRMSDKNSTHKRRALKRLTSDGTLSTIDVQSPLTKELQNLLTSQNHKCLYCKCDISDGATPRHLDHVQPLSKGGTHTISNVQWLCAKCNLLKSDKVA